MNAGQSGTDNSPKRPQQLDELLWVPPRFVRPSAVAEPVQGIADIHVRHALPPQFDDLGHDLGVDGPQAGSRG